MPYVIPEGLRVYAIGDVHGYLVSLKNLEQRIYADQADFKGEVVIVYLGDYVDRGPDSKGVLKHLMAQSLIEDDVQRRFLLGNHEQGMLNFIENPCEGNWLYWGGTQTASSFGIEITHDASAEKKMEAANAMALALTEYMKFLSNLELFYIFGDYLFAHAGLDPLKSLKQQTPDDFTFIRQPFLSWHEHPDYQPLPKKVVHGHTISKEPIIRPHRIGVDTGHFEGGPLTAAVLEGEGVRFIQVLP